MSFFKRNSNDSNTLAAPITFTEYGEKRAQDVNVLSDGGFNEMLVADLLPVIRGNVAYNLIPANFSTFTSGSGAAVTATNRLVKVSSGTSLNGYGTLQSFRSVNHKAGSSYVIRVSAYFGTPVAGTWSGVGGFTVTDEVSFGYSGTDFGIWHRYNGAAEVVTVTVTGAAGGSENLTLVLNSVELTIPLTSGTTAHNAKEIADYITTNSTVWDASQSGSTVVISARSDGAKNGTYSFTSSTATGSIARTTSGVSKTSSHTPMANWNGSYYSGFDPSKGNCYQILVQNNFGNVFFYILNPKSGKLEVCHIIEWANNGASSALTNPSIRIGAYATSVTATTNIDVYVASLAAFLDIGKEATRNPRSYSSTKSIDTTLTNLVTIRNKRVYNGLINQAEIEPRYLTLANDGGKSAVFELRTNPTVSGTANFQDVGTNLISEYDTAGTTVSGGTLLASFTVAKGQSVEINLRELEIRIPPTLRFTICAKMASGAAADLTAAITWLEDI